MFTERELDVLQRRARGESQQAIARSLKISQAAVSKFERNAQQKILDAELVLKRSKELNIKTEKGLTGEKVSYGGGKK